MNLTKVPTEDLIAELEHRAANWIFSEAEAIKVAARFYEAGEIARQRRETAASYSWEAGNNMPIAG